MRCILLLLLGLLGSSEVNAASSQALLAAAHRRNSSTTIPDLIARWKFDEVSGTTAADSSGNGYDITFGSSPVWTNGVFSGAAYVTGSMAGVSPSAITNLLSGASHATITTWVKSSGAFSIGSVLSGGGGPSTRFEFALNAGKTYFVAENGASGYGYVNLTPSSWTHLALVYDGTLAGNAKVLAYINSSTNALTMFGSFPTTLSTSLNPFRIGTGSDVFAVDDYRVYSRTLTSNEVSQIYAGGN